MFNIMYQTTKQLQQKIKPLEQQKNGENMWKRWGFILHKAPSLDESSMKLSSFGVVKTTIKPTFEWMINTQ